MTLQFLLRLLKFCPASVALFGRGQGPGCLGAQVPKLVVHLQALPTVATLATVALALASLAALAALALASLARALRHELKAFSPGSPEKGRELSSDLYAMWQEFSWILGTILTLHISF